MVVLTIEGEDGGADVKFEVRLESSYVPKSSQHRRLSNVSCGIHAPMI
jgi:hypothetical protein